MPSAIYGVHPHRRESLNGVMAMTVVSSDRRDFIRHPTNRVVGTVADSEKAREAVDALIRAGFKVQDIDVLHGDEDLHRLDPTGAQHGFLAQVQRTVIRTFDLNEFKHLTHIVEDVQAGRFVIMVLAKRSDQRLAAGDILHKYGAEFVGFYGRWAWTDLPALGKYTPADVPELFARAWNTRDPDALAALFDEDAEFVNTSGTCCHDRESIRHAHRAWLKRTGGAPIMASGDTRVKLLSPDVAVVHARMTLSGETAAAEGTHPERTTIVSFVVHRAGERWLCASAQNTDLLPDPESTNDAART
jgi:uncharacterized protein (TIGR02246 family)